MLGTAKNQKYAAFFFLVFFVQLSQQLNRAIPTKFNLLSHSTYLSLSSGRAPEITLQMCHSAVTNPQRKHEEGAGEGVGLYL